MSVDVVVFEDLELNRSIRQLFRGGEPVPLQPKAYELLCALIDRRDRVVSKDELLELLWCNEHVVPEVLTTAVRALRAALGDSARGQQFIRTVRGTGYQFVAKLTTRPPLVSAAARARHALFVGRRRELAIFEQLVANRSSSSKRVLFVHGRGGIGKTSMLHEIGFVCARRGLAHVQLNAEQLVARPAPFETAIGEAIGRADLYAALHESSGMVLLIDNFDLLVGLASWFMDTFLPRMPDHVIVVLASRSAPRQRWTTDPAWQALVTDVLLGPFDDRESRDFLATRGVPSADVDAILGFTKGLPLALAVAAAAVERGVHPTQVPEERDVIDVLVEVFTDRAPSVRHRHALEIASLLSSFDEALLASMLDSEDVVDLYTWIASLPFVRQVPAGLQVHALVRDALLAHLRWRNAERLRALAARCYALHFKLLENVGASVDRITLTNRIMSLGRHHPTLRSFYTYDDLPEISLELATGGDLGTAVEEIVVRHEGAASGQIFRRWQELGLGDVWLARDEQDLPAGIALVLSLPFGRLSELCFDPAIDSIRRYLDHAGGATTAEHITVYRYLVARDGYQAVSPVMQRCHEILNYDLHTQGPTVSHSFNVYGEPDIWGPVSMFAEFERLHGHDFELGDRRFGIFGHSWRAMPLERWADTITRKLATGRIA